MDTEIEGFVKGDFIMIDGLNAVVVATDEHEDIPEDHVAMFGFEGSKRQSVTGVPSPSPEVLVVPLSICEDGQVPNYSPVQATSKYAYNPELLQ